MPKSAPDVPSIAEAIERYLDRYPEAADSAEGIQRWWLASGLEEQPLSRVQTALDLLEARRIVVKTVLEGGCVIYSSLRARERRGH
jgi:hypothetical protein